MFVSIQARPYFTKSPTTPIYRTMLQRYLLFLRLALGIIEYNGDVLENTPACRLKFFQSPTTPYLGPRRVDTLSLKREKELRLNASDRT